MHHNIIDKRSLELHRLVVRKMEENPERVIHAALKNINRWMRTPNIPETLLLEWKKILLQRNKQEIRRILLSRSGRSQQLRQATPFCGVLSNHERLQIFRKYYHQ